METKLIAKNPTAYHNYEIIDKIESQKILRYIYLMLLDIPKRYWR